MNPSLANRSLNINLKAPWIFADELNQSLKLKPLDRKSFKDEKAREAGKIDLYPYLRKSLDKVRTFLEENPDFTL